jgi:hypothetical protein
MTKQKQNPLIAAITADYKLAQKDCWKYHKDKLKELGVSSHNDCDNAVMDMDFGGDEYCNMAYFTGYFRGLEAARQIICEYEAE